MKMMYLLLFVLFLLFGCGNEPQIQPRGAYLYLYNNSSETAKVIGYKDSDPETVFQELQIFPDQLKSVGFFSLRSRNGLIFESDRLEIYKGGTFIYEVEDLGENGYSRLFADSVEQITEDFYIRVSPLFKWCGNELCEEQ